MKTINSLLFSLLFLLAGCNAAEPADSLGRMPAELLSVIDGDTIKVLYEGREETIRYLLVDTPETNHPELGQQPLGPEATGKNKDILKAAEIEIEFDEGRQYDDYGRLLAYVYTDGVSVQEQLLEAGLARVGYVFPPNTQYIEEFEQAEDIAQEMGIGIWETAGYVTDRGFNSEVFEQTGSGTDSTCRIKGNINRKGEKIYHLPGALNYEQTKPEEWFCSVEKAESAGFRTSPN
ncbi:thermonuclease family protein [Planococcus lenghuensis]|uniref:Nuclease n=1 Tax=Planococcus lenghuensis TaxID=2213202 RepID=A0A1Q2L0I7_9BACL|nr:thermonuclease family protein [Planococcus lenghuensis]AQQ53884.1 nuclease [Planococcus lenghuensis]